VWKERISPPEIPQCLLLFDSVASVLQEDMNNDFELQWPRDLSVTARNDGFLN
jgi:hypothetical protein